ncbi:hypothetical protein [Rhizobium sp. IMFF44]|uniref:hypothetical protein n=1 Tax=unclassified Rhizobium TaxID=2613769 RepID=UPI0035BAE95B
MMKLDEHLRIRKSCDMSAFLFDLPILPKDFRFPDSYTGLVRNGELPDITPWEFLAGDMGRSLSYYGSMLQRYKQLPLIPFAIIADGTGFHNDGYVTLALFDGSDVHGEPRVRIFDYATPKKSPWDNIAYQNFEAWLEAAKAESADHKLECADVDATDQT